MVADWHDSINNARPMNPWQDAGTRMAGANPTTLCANDRAKWGSRFHMNSASSSMTQPRSCHTGGWLEPQRLSTSFSSLFSFWFATKYADLFFARSSGTQVTFRPPLRPQVHEEARAQRRGFKDFGPVMDACRASLRQLLGQVGDQTM